jgi:hypothetical protein
MLDRSRTGYIHNRGRAVRRQLEKGCTFQPCPSSDAAFGNGRSGPGLAIAPFPFSPVGFSGETIRDCASGIRVGSAAKPVPDPADDWENAFDPKPNRIATVIAGIALHFRKFPLWAEPSIIERLPEF